MSGWFPWNRPMGDSLIKSSSSNLALIPNLQILDCFNGSKDHLSLLNHKDNNGDNIVTHLASQVLQNEEYEKQAFRKFEAIFLKTDKYDQFLTEKNALGDTPLHLSVIHRNLEFLEFLVKKRVNASIRDSRNLTPIEMAKRLALDDFVVKLEEISSIPLEYSPQVYQWGQILSDSSTTSSKPSPVMFNDVDSSISQIGFGNKFSILLTDTGKLYSFGLCSYGKLGHDTKKDLHYPTKIESLDNVNVKSIACGKDHALALDDIGCVYVWGNGSNGRLGFGTPIDYQKIPKILPAFNGTAISQISCGSEHTLALDVNGKVYSWGSSMFGRLGYKTPGRISESTPRLISDLPVDAIQVSCGNWYSVVLGKNGQVYSFGHNGSGRLGRSKESTEDSQPKKVEISARVKKISSGMSFTLALTESNVVVGWGINVKNILAQSNVDHFYSPTTLNHLLPYPINNIETGDSHALVLTDHGEVLTLGSGEFGQTGQGEHIANYFQKLSFQDGSNVFKIAAGSNSSMMCLSSGHQLLGMEMASLLEDIKFEDLRITVNQNDSDYISAHRSIVSSRCQPINQLLKMEIENPNQSNELSISQTTKISTKTLNGIIYLNFHNVKLLSTLKLLIKFIYTDHTIIKEENILELGEISYLLKIERLSYICNFKSKNVKSLDLLPSSSLSEDLGKLSTDEFLNYYHDIVIKVHDDYSTPKSQFIDEAEKNNTTSQLKSYKVLLHLRSNYFRMMFGGSFSESEKKVIDIFETSKPTLQLLLDYIYKNQVPEDPNDCIDLIIMADVHQMPRLKELCAGEIRKQIDMENICYIYRIGCEYDVKPLIACSEAKIVNYTGKIRELNFFDQLTDIQKTNLLKLNNNNKI